jgi:hypothetical protein
MEEIKVIDVKLKNIILYDDHSMETLVVTRWNGSIDLTIQGKEINLSDTMIPLLIKALQKTKTITYNSED